MFSSSEGVISRVLSCLYLSEGGYPFLCFCCVSNCCLAERCYFSSFGVVLGVLWKDLFFMTLFLDVFESWTICVFLYRPLLFLEFLLVFTSFSCR